MKKKIKLITPVVSAITTLAVIPAMANGVTPVNSKNTKQNKQALNFKAVSNKAAIIPASETNIGPAKYFWSDIDSITYVDASQQPVSESDSLLESIQTNAFAYSNLTSLKLPPHVRLIDKYAFLGCKQLTSIDLTLIQNAFFGSELQIGAGAFDSIAANGTIILNEFTGISQVQRASVLSLIKSTMRCAGVPLAWHVMVGNTDEGDLTSSAIPLQYIITNTDHTEIDNFDKRALIVDEYGNAKYSTFIVPGGITSLAPGVMAKLRLTVDTVSILNSLDPEAKLTTIPDECFAGFVRLQAMALPESITEIGNLAFADCTSLETCDLSACSSLTEIPDGAFEGVGENTASGITVSLPNTIEIIGAGAFRDATINEVDLSNTALTTIGTGAFNQSTIASVSLPSTITAISDEAFKNCTHLHSVTFASGAHSLTSIGNYAFYGCTQLTEIKLPKPVDGEQKVGDLTIGNKAISGCTRLSKLDLSEWKTDDFEHIQPSSSDVFDGASTRGDVVFNDDVSGQEAITLLNTLKSAGLPRRWTRILPESLQNYVCISYDEGTTVTLDKNGDINFPNIEISTDDGDSWDSPETLHIEYGTPFTLPNSSLRILIRGTNPDGWNKYEINEQEELVPTQYGTIKFAPNEEYPDARVTISGNIMTLLGGWGEGQTIPTKVPAMSTFDNLFYDSSCLEEISSGFLPATTIGQGCYECMFQSCTNLVSMPDLPATMHWEIDGQGTATETSGIAKNCYCYMFDGCTSLTDVTSVLPATTVPETAYQDMFRGCSSISTVSQTFLGGTDGITSVEAGGCNEMFSDCTNLVEAPNLGATTLAEHCYTGMFANCINLQTMPQLPATTIPDNGYDHMFYNCSSLRTMRGYDNKIVLPGTTIGEAAYESMFEDCAVITGLQVAFDTWPVYEETRPCTENWVRNAGIYNGSFYCPAALPHYDKQYLDGCNYIPADSDGTVWKIVEL